ncbi:hypothetical protein PGB90_002812 [Kerria lacca]
MSYATPRAFFLGVGDDASTSGSTPMALMTYMCAGSKANVTIARFPLRTITPLDYCPCGQAGTESVRLPREVDDTIHGY